MSAQRTHWMIDSPVGELTLVAHDARLSGVYMHEHRHQPSSSSFGVRNRAAFGAAIEQLEEYFAGQRRAFDLELAADTGTPFQRTVWAALRDIPYGQTRTYAQLAEAVGRPSAARAVGAANGRNPISIIVPCHRVIGASGDMTGYRGGLANKVTLLRLEGAVVDEQPRLPGVDDARPEFAEARSTR